MTGRELRAWREKIGWTQVDLMVELEVKSRQTMSTWERAEKIPRVVELAITALDQIEASRKRSGFERQFTPESIANRHVAQGAKYFGIIGGGYKGKSSYASDASPSRPWTTQPNRTEPLPPRER
ncbi:MAG TPA: helix-turn-helix transcriptional regulator [Xanthobacteraceae bacterium]|nr:helix-turn-helix transcriptional regulator [Xanthobacteraceae bacterium]